jgi:ATP-dependent Clp protease ATP-binding subunit ClpB
VGFEEGGQLTEAVRRRPYSVVLFDEIEKAHKDVFNVLLQVLDEGRLTDGQGRVVDFKNTVLIMTSNLGAHALMDTSLSEKQKQDAVQEALRSAFRPEFLNRIDEIIYFKALGPDQIANIVKIQLDQVVERLKAKRIDIEFSPEAVNWLAERGFDPLFGARPLKRVIQQEVLNVLSKKLIAQEVKPGEKLVVRVLGRNLAFL